jgi:signal transduction histidine kinase
LPCSEISTLVERFGIGSQRTRGVLLVDDEELNLAVLRGFLEEAWQVHEAGSGAEALAIAERAPLDVVVTDHRMPGMTGVELLEELQARRPDVAGIVLTAYGDMQTLESAINRARVFRFLRKPWEPPDLLGAVEQASAHVAQQRTIKALVTLLARRSDELHSSLEQLRSQQQILLDLERMSTIGRLSSGITHDLRNVMVGLRSAEWEMAQGAVSPALREVFTLSLSSVDGLLRTLQLLHEYVRTGSIALQLTSIEPGAMIRDALALSRMDVLFNRRRVRSEVPPALPRLLADRQKLTQVLLNLVRNALHATPDGAAVRVVARGLPGDEVEFAVEDEGTGIAPEIRERLFQPFASTKGGEGLGMGLYMARLIVELHRGRISAEDLAQGGTRFEVVLPANGAA